MTESEKLAREGLQMLYAKGWPENAAKELMDVFMRAGMHFWQERIADETARNEALISRVTH